MRISDWSSDVCSSDLRRDGQREEQPQRGERGRHEGPGGKLEAHAGVPSRRHAGLVPASNLPRTPAFAARWMPEQVRGDGGRSRSEEHTSELQSLMRTSYAVFCLQKTNSPSLSRRNPAGETANT